MAVRPIDAVQVLKDINRHHKPTPVSEFESGFNNGLNQAMWIITHAPTLTPPNEWVSVEERLPIKSGEYLAYTTDENIGLIEFDKDCGEFGFSKEYYQDGAYLDSEWAKADWITHWMPLPAPPDRRPPEGEEDHHD